jgi:hypothetical protein
MAEEIESPETGSESNPAVDPAALAMALAGAAREDANAYLADQRAWIADQRRHMHKQFKQLGPKLWELRLGVLLRVATAFIGVAVAAALAWLVWHAAGSNDLVIDAFAVPPDLATRGLSGPVVAAKLSDKIAVMQAETVSSRPAGVMPTGFPAVSSWRFPKPESRYLSSNVFCANSLAMTCISANVIRALEVMRECDAIFAVENIDFVLLSHANLSP